MGSVVDSTYHGVSAQTLFERGKSLERGKLFDWQQRVFDEHAELAVRADKLAEFLSGAVFQSLEQPERVLLREQLHHMRAYRDVLTQRISRWL